jgi:hypothetical protein
MAGSTAEACTLTNLGIAASTFSYSLGLVSGRSANWRMAMLTAEYVLARACLRE